LLGNVLGGGAHAKTKMAIQEILVIPRARNFPRVVDDLFEIWNEVGERLKNAALNHEGAWSVDIDEKSAMDIVYQVAHGHHADLGVDFAANQMWNNGYRWSDCNLSRDRHIERVLEFIADYNLIYVEDPLHADDWTGFAKIKESAKRALICGDDLTATNLGRIKTAIDMRAVSAAIIKPNQTGTVSGALAAIDMCKKNGIVPIVSHRSSETTDTAICGLAQLTPFAKLGISGIRIVKLNELLRRWYRTKKPKMTYLKI
jgi:enolase